MGRQGNPCLLYDNGARWSSNRAISYKYWTYTMFETTCRWFCIPSWDKRVSTILFSFSNPFYWKIYKSPTADAFVSSLFYNTWRVSGHVPHFPWILEIVASKYYVFKLARTITFVCYFELGRSRFILVRVDWSTIQTGHYIEIPRTLRNRILHGPAMLQWAMYQRNSLGM